MHRKMALSKPDAADMSVLQLSGVKAYHGRVDGYLSQCCFENIKATFICGSPLFAFDVSQMKGFHRSSAKRRYICKKVFTHHHIAYVIIGSKSLPIIKIM